MGFNLNKELFSSLKMKTSNEINLFERRINDVKKNANKLKYDYKQQVELEECKISNELKEEERDVYYSIFKQEIYSKFPEMDYYDDYIQITMYYSIVVDLYTFLEIKINDIYSIIEKKRPIIEKKERIRNMSCMEIVFLKFKNLIKSLCTLKKTGFEKRKKNRINELKEDLEFNLNLNLKCLDKYISNFTLFNDVRNIITHSFGNVEITSSLSKKAKNKIKFLKENKSKFSIEIINNKIIFKDNSFALRFLELIKNTLLCVIDVLIRDFPIFEKTSPVIEEQYYDNRNPCSGMCNFNENDVCLTCLLTKKEFDKWELFSEEERDKILSRIIKERRNNP